MFLSRHIRASLWILFPQGKYDLKRKGKVQNGSIWDLFSWQRSYVCPSYLIASIWRWRHMRCSLTWESMTTEELVCRPSKTPRTLSQSSSAICNCCSPDYILISYKWSFDTCCTWTCKHYSIEKCNHTPGLCSSASQQGSPLGGCVWFIFPLFPSRVALKLLTCSRAAAEYYSKYTTLSWEQTHFKWRDTPILVSDDPLSLGSEIYIQRFRPKPPG